MENDNEEKLDISAAVIIMFHEDGHLEIALSGVEEENLPKLLITLGKAIKKKKKKKIN